jgi:hypothetical protein
VRDALNRKDIPAMRVESGDGTSARRRRGRVGNERISGAGLFSAQWRKAGIFTIPEQLLEIGR